MLHDLTPYNQADFDIKDQYLWIWNPTNIPPHMGLSVEGSYFSLKANGVDLALDITELIELISRKKIPVLAINLRNNFTLSACHEIFSYFKRTVPHKITCLNPIKDVLEVPSPLKLVELLKELDARNALGKKFTWNIDASIVELPEYSMEDVHAHLGTLLK